MESVLRYREVWRKHMNDEEKELMQYIKQFRAYSKQSKAKGTVDTILVYRDDCHFCHDQFRFFKNKVKAEFYSHGDEIRVRIGNPSLTHTPESKASLPKKQIARLKSMTEKWKNIINRIYVIERNSEEAKKMLEKKDISLAGVPSWIDAETGEIINTGAIGEEGMTSVFCTEEVCLRNKGKKA